MSSLGNLEKGFQKFGTYDNSLCGQVSAINKIGSLSKPARSEIVRMKAPRNPSIEDKFDGAAMSAKSINVRPIMSENFFQHFIDFYGLLRRPHSCFRTKQVQNSPKSMAPNINGRLPILSTR